MRIDGRLGLSARRYGLALVLMSGTAMAQSAPRLNQLPPNTNISATLRDRSTIYGRLERMDSDSLIIVGSAGRIAIAVANVRELRNAGIEHKTKEGTTEYWYPEANTTRMFFGPTGRTLKQGEGYFADHDVFIASASVGITDRLQLGGGTLIVPNSQFWFVMPKVGIVQGEKLNVSVGALYGGIGGINGGIAYAVGTYGGTDHNLTVGFGQGFSGKQVGGKPVFMIGGESRASRRVAFLTENYFGAGSNDGLLMYGIRFLGEKFSVDLALMNTVRTPVFPGYPYVDFVIKW